MINISAFVNSDGNVPNLDSQPFALRHDIML